MKKKKKNLSNQAYEAIKLAIITCDLAPGQQIPQHQLVEKYNIGTTPIREALMRLVQEGLVEPIPRFGYIVSHVTLSDIHELYELRLILESAAARLAATRATEEQLNEIAENARFTYVFGDRDSYHDFLNKNTELHLMIARLSGNKRLVKQISKVHDELIRVFHFGLDMRNNAEEMRDDHITLVEALCARDAEKAAAIVETQIAASQDWMLNGLTKKYGGDPNKSPLRDVHIYP